MTTRWKTHAIVSRLQAELEELRFRNQFRRLERVEGINLYSNDYLALSDDPRLRLAVQNGCETQEQTASTGSRLLSGNAAIWEQLEGQCASFVGAEASLYFSSGYLANVGLLSSILKPETTVFSDSANHASLIDGIRLSKANRVIYPHGDLQFLERALRAAGSERVIVTESIFSMEGDRAPLESLYELADRYDAGLIIDEAHATGVVGPNGRGHVAFSGRPDCVVATVHTCGKALASMGAFVAGSEALRRYLINYARPFIFSTALAPYVAAQTARALTIVADAEDRRRHLHELAGDLRASLRDRGWNIGPSQSQIVPVILGSNETAVRVARKLVHCGFGVKAIRPPTVPAGTARLRLSLTSRLERSDLTALVDALDDAR